MAQGSDPFFGGADLFSEDPRSRHLAHGPRQGRPAPLYEIMTSLVKHLHAFIKDVEPTNEEWMAGIKFLTDTGHMCTDWRQEFILLSDTLGVSMLVETINNRKPSRRHRDHGARPLPHPGRAASAQRRQHLPRRQGRADAGHAAASPTLQGKPIKARCSTSGRPMRTASTTSSKRASSPT